MGSMDPWDPAATAANPKAGNVMHLEKYTVTNSNTNPRIAPVLGHTPRRARAHSTLPFYNDGVAVMPEHAALAGRGVVFDRAYTGISSCSPSRSAILSGLPNRQNGMYG